MKKKYISPVVEYHEFGDELCQGGLILSRTITPYDVLSKRDGQFVCFDEDDYYSYDEYDDIFLNETQEWGNLWK